MNIDLYHIWELNLGSNFVVDMVLIENYVAEGTKYLKIYMARYITYLVT